MKQILALLLLLFFLKSNAQTNVSGGIYSNTTWTLANSPYIVTDTVVVFPNVTLTIEPGVRVKFNDHKRLEIRQATLLAVGTSTDSIIFTSNSASPVAGIWGDIVFNLYLNGNSKFNYCNFYYASIAVNNIGGNIASIKNSNFRNNTGGIYSTAPACVIDTCSFADNDYGMNLYQYGIVKHCNFVNNQTGFKGGCDSLLYSSFDSNQLAVSVTIAVYMDNCTVKHNGDGIQANSGGYSTIQNCTIDSNDNTGFNILSAALMKILTCEINGNSIGLKSSSAGLIVKYNMIENNSIGIQFFYYYSDSIYCNKICNNTSFDFDYEVAFGSNINLSHNYWCTTDSATIQSRIHDGYDNINLGLINFIPFDTFQCSGLINPVCSSDFTLYPDTSIPHHYWAVNMATGTGPLTYLWSWGDYSFDNIAYPSHTYASAGTYTICLTITDSIGCTHNTCTAYQVQKSASGQGENTIITVNVVAAIPTSVQNIKVLQSWSVFPNPASVTARVNYTLSTPVPVSIEVYDVLGNKLQQPVNAGEAAGEHHSVIDVQKLASGIYVLQIRAGDEIASQKIIVMN